MTETINIHRAKSISSRLVERALPGADLVVARGCLYSAPRNGSASLPAARSGGQTVTYCLPWSWVR
jgi:hypothetical protein